MDYIPDPAELYDRQDAEKAREEKRRIAQGKVCKNCGEAIMEDTAYLIDGNFWCNDCILGAVYWMEDD